MMLITLNKKLIHISKSEKDIAVTHAEKKISVSCSLCKIFEVIKDALYWTKYWDSINAILMENGIGVRNEAGTTFLIQE